MEGGDTPSCGAVKHEVRERCVSRDPGDSFVEAVAFELDLTGDC